MKLHDEHVRERYRWCPGDPAIAMSQYRLRILNFKREYGTARSLVHHRKLIESYLWAKRRVLA